MAAVMTSGQGSLDDIAKFIAECEHAGIRVLLPSVNKSFTDFAIVKETGEITFGLNAIKNVGRKVSEAIVEERKANGPYSDLTDFVKRAGRDVINKKTLEGLAYAGALSDFGERKLILENIEKILDFSSSYYTQGDSSQMGMFDDGELGVPTQIGLQPTEPATEKELLAWEREYLGTFVSQHPLKDMLPKLDGLVRAINSLSAADDNKVLRVAGIVGKCQKIVTKRGDTMMFVTIEDLGGSMEVIVFPKVLEDTKKLWERDKLLIISGKVNVKEYTEDKGEEIVIVAEPKILAEDVREAEDREIARLREADGMLGDRRRPQNQPAELSRVERREDKVVIKIPKGFTNGKLAELKQTLAKYPGEEPLSLEVFVDGRWQVVPTQTKARVTAELEKELAGLLAG